MLKKIFYSVIGIVVLSIVSGAVIGSKSPQPSTQENSAEVQATTSLPVAEAATTSPTKTVAVSTQTQPVTSPQPVTQTHFGVRTKTSGCLANQALPDPACSPGAVLTTDTSIICVSGYTQTVRDVPDSEKQQVFAEYGIDYSLHSNYEVDHIISLELGGSNDISNLFPESYSIQYGARVKDTLENYLHQQVCRGKLSIAVAQQEIATNWLKYYLQWKGASVSAQTSSSTSTQATSTPTQTTTTTASAAYYTSSYGSSKYYYPASCSAWKSLSQSYVVSFDSLDALLAKYPNRTLSPQCQ